MRDRTRNAVERQLEALGGGLFEIGVQNRADKKMIPRTWSMRQILSPSNLRWLKARNANGFFIRVCPKYPHSFVFVDDLSRPMLARVDAKGLEATVVVQSSPGNYQAWLNVGTLLTRDELTLLSQEIASELGADRNAANWRQKGCLAGFTNCKEKHRRSDGLFPFVALEYAHRREFRRAAALAEAARKAQRDIEVRWEREKARYTPRPQGEGLRKSIHDFHVSPDYSGDLHVADFAYSIYALAHGRPERLVMRDVLEGRDLRKKGSRRDQRRYAESTVRNAARKGLHRGLDRGATLVGFGGRG